MCACIYPSVSQKNYLRNSHQNYMIPFKVSNFPHLVTYDTTNIFYLCVPLLGEEKNDFKFKNKRTKSF